MRGPYSRTKSGLFNRKCERKLSRSTTIKYQNWSKIRNSPLTNFNLFCRHQKWMWTSVFLSSLTIIIQRQFVEFESTWLFAHIAVCVLGAELVHGDGVLQGLHTRLQTERNLGVAHRVSASRQDIMQKHDIVNRWWGRSSNADQFRMETYSVIWKRYLCPSMVHRDTPQRSGLNFASWGM